MTISSPITLTVNSVDKVLTRLNQDNFGAVYRLKEADDEWQLTIRHSYEGKAGPAQIERHNADFMHTHYVGTDRIPVTTQAYLIMRNPRNQSGVDCTQIAKALFVWANTYAADLSAGQN